MKNGLLLGSLVFLGVIVSGCRSTSTIYEYSDDGKQIKKKIVTDESVVKTVMDEMKNKNVAWGTNGWVAQLEVTLTSQDTYMPTIKMRAANGNHWHISFLSNVEPAIAIKNIMSVGVELKSGDTSLGSK